MSLPTIDNPVPYKRIVIPQGADFRLALCLISRDDAGVAEVIDTTGWEVLLQVRKEPSDASPVLVEASTANGRVVVGIQGTGSNQVNIDLKVPASVTKNLDDWGEGGYDLLCTYPNLDVDMHLSGPACLKTAYTWKA